jgi:CheY-like chemotaxis protein
MPKRRRMAKERILIVDDDPDIVEAMRLILEAQEYEVISAGSSAEGLATVKETNPDLIILDVMMETDTEGFHFAYALRNADAGSEYEAFKNTPILMLTAISQRTGMQFDPGSDEAFLPVDDFVEKPIKPEDLVSKIQKLISARKGG